MNKIRQIAVLIGLGLLSLSANAAPDLSTKEKVAQAIKMEHRTKEEIKRDVSRSPANALEFMGLKDDMKVIEFAPGLGWYTKILGPVLKDKGELIMAHRGEWLDEAWANLTSPLLSKVKEVRLDNIDWNQKTPEFIFTDHRIDFKTRDADMFLSVWAYHNLPNGDGDGDSGDRLTFNKAVFNALKPGGSYVVIDHTKRHMQESNDETWRRSDPVRVIKEIEEAGFTFTKYSDMFYRLDDELRYEVRRRSVRGDSDRFFFIFHKPE